MKDEVLIREALEECLGHRKTYQQHGDDEMNPKDYGNNEGWIEALNFVLKDYDYNPSLQVCETLDQYCREEKEALGLDKISGGFCGWKIYKDNDEEFLFEVSSGVQSDVTWYKNIQIAAINKSNCEITEL